jgi:gamma-glutamyltranspeptidase/glutathione hydrolase
MPQAISAGHSKTLEAAKTILQAGGNAFDAAIAAHLAMFITEPCMASAGGAGFAMCHSVEHGTRMLDFFTQTPMSKELNGVCDFREIKVDFGNEIETFQVGLGAAAVPGSIAGLFEIHASLGSLPFKELAAPAIDMAKSGVEIDDFQSIDLVLLESVFKMDPSIHEFFFPNERLLLKGDVLRMPPMADFLEFLIQEGVKGFYEGDIGKIITKDSKERGGFLKREDFTNYQVHWRKPMHLKHFGHNIALPNGPSLGGAIMAILFAYLDRFNGSWYQSIREIQKNKLSGKDMNRLIKSLYPNLGFELHGDSGSSLGTSHFNIVDKWGNAVALTSSIGEGSGYFIPGTAMQLNNMLGEAALLPEGFHSWTPNTRLHSMMSPTLVLDSNKNVSYCGGSGGAGRIPFVMAQVMENLLAKQMNLEESIFSPRVYIHDGKFHFETGARVEENMEIGHQEWNYQSLFFGGVHSIHISEREGKKIIEALGDARRYGVSEVF